MTDHSVSSLLQNSIATVDESYLACRVTNTSHLAALTLVDSAPAVVAALLPLADDAHQPGHVTCDVTDCAVTVRLEHKELWESFSSLGTEMVITKSGRYHQLSIGEVLGLTLSEILFLRSVLAWRQFQPPLGRIGETCVTVNPATRTARILAYVG